MDAINVNKKKLQADLEAVLNRFHQENPGYEVFSIFTDTTKVQEAGTGQTHVLSTRISCTIHVL